jgi:hypothetical protein
VWRVCVRLACGECISSLIRAGPGRGQAQFPARRPPNRGGGFESWILPKIGLRISKSSSCATPPLKSADSDPWLLWMKKGHFA